MAVIIRMILKERGNSLEAADTKLKIALEKLKVESNIHFYKCNPQPAENESENKWGAVAELEFEVPDFRRFMDLCTKYVPMSIEILDPLKFEFDSYETAEHLNCFLTKIDGYKKVQDWQ